MIKSVPINKKLILFDGVCNLCNSAVRFVEKHDKNDIFLFAPLESDVGREVLSKYQIDTDKIDSILLYSNKDGLSIKSTAALKIARHLNFPINLMVIFFIVPTFIRHGIYDFIARNRYKWFGKKDDCMVPTAAQKAKFLN